MNLTAILIVVVMWGASVGGAFWYGTEVGSDHEVAAKARDTEVARIATEAATVAAASAIAGIEVKNVTLTRKLEREVLTREVFRDCRSGPEPVRLLNAGSAIAPAGPAASAGGQLPTAGPAR